MKSFIITQFLIIYFTSFVACDADDYNVSYAEEISKGEFFIIFLFHTKQIYSNSFLYQENVDFFL